MGFAALVFVLMCFAMIKGVWLLCYAVLCSDLGYAMLCHATLICYDVLCCAIGGPNHSPPVFVMLRYAMI